MQKYNSMSNRPNSKHYWQAIYAMIYGTSRRFTSAKNVV
jgi:hypothetical protein